MKGFLTKEYKVLAQAFFEHAQHREGCEHHECPMFCNCQVNPMKNRLQRVLKKIEAETQEKSHENRKL